MQRDEAEVWGRGCSGGGWHGSWGGALKVFKGHLSGRAATFSALTGCIHRWLRVCSPGRGYLCECGRRKAPECVCVCDKENLCALVAPTSHCAPHSSHGYVWSHRAVHSPHQLQLQPQPQPRQLRLGAPSKRRRLVAHSFRSESENHLQLWQALELALVMAAIERSKLL